MLSEEVGFVVEHDNVNAVVKVLGVPCLVAGNRVATCTIEKSYDPSTGVPDARIGGDLHVAMVTLDGAYDGLVYRADGAQMDGIMQSDGQTWCLISHKKGTPQNPQLDRTPRDLIFRYARRIASEALAVNPELARRSEPNLFNIPNTYEVRAGIGEVQDKVRQSVIMIVGLGGTGSYILDLMAKTPVREIHLLDNDTFEYHNVMRAPGAPSAVNISEIGQGNVSKVDYYAAKYADLRMGIYPHNIQVQESDSLRELITEYKPTWAFVCIDQLREGESSRQDGVYQLLTDSSIPFIDSGISLGLEEEGIHGAVTTSYHEPGSTAWRQYIPNARVVGDALGYRNLQLPEANALAASLAVMEWRRRTGQYQSEDDSHLHQFQIGAPRVVKAA